MTILLHNWLHLQQVCLALDCISDIFVNGLTAGELHILTLKLNEQEHEVRLYFGMRVLPHRTLVHPPNGQS